MRFLILLIILFCLASRISYAEVSVVDDLGNTITLPQSAQRVISLSPGTTELVYSAGGLAYLIGVVSYSDYPEAAKKIPQVGSYNSVDIEKIVALAPDLIIAWDSGNPPLQVSKLKKLGLNVYRSEPRDFIDIPSTIRRLGILMGTSEVASKSSVAFNDRLLALQKQYPQTLDKKQVFIQIWNQPLMSINGKHLISKIVTQCNGVNIFHDASQLTLTLDAEIIIQKNPDAVLATRLGDLGESWLARWKQWGFLTAVSRNQLYAVNPDFVVRHTPRILDGIQQVCGFLHSER